MHTEYEVVYNVSAWYWRPKGQPRKPGSLNYKDLMWYPDKDVAYAWVSPDGGPARLVEVTGREIASNDNGVRPWGNHPVEQPEPEQSDPAPWDQFDWSI